MYPIILDLAEKKVLVIGAGEVGERKINSLVQAGADVTVVSETCPGPVRKLAVDKKLKLIERAYRQGDCEGYFLVIGATDSEDTNREISDECRRLGLLVNIVDRPELCSFYVPAVVRRGDLQIAITTSGKSPALAREIRKELQEQYGEEYAVFIERLGNLRDKIKHEISDNPGERNKRIREMFEREFGLFMNGKNSTGK